MDYNKITFLFPPLPPPFLLAGVEDGQTVRMPVGKKEIFITFRVRIVTNAVTYSLHNCEGSLNRG